MFLTALSTFAFVIALGVIAAFFRKNEGSDFEQPLQSYLLAGSKLKQHSVVNLLMSSSFGLNGLLYQVWLGYSVGVWGLVTQGAWAFSFVLLSNYSSVIKGSKSLHELLGKQFDSTTRQVASACSLIGIMFMICWETGIGTNTFQSAFALQTDIPINKTYVAASLLTISIVFGSLFYTLVGGLRGNALADIILNVVKVASILAITFLVIKQASLRDLNVYTSALFPSLETMKQNLGWWGLITNLMFSIGWQFVDNSTWQTIIAGRDDEVSKNLKWSALTVFIAPGIIGTILGVTLVTLKNLDPNNIFSSLIPFVAGNQQIIIVLLFLLIVSCVMSLIDGMFLASGFTLVIDLLHPHETLEEIDKDPKRAAQTLRTLKLLLLLIAGISVWGLTAFFNFLGVNIFEYVFIVIIAQLAILGPVVMSLFKRSKNRVPLWSAIVIALIVGFGSVILGKITNIAWLLDGAGTLTALTSIVIGTIITKK